MPISEVMKVGVWVKLIFNINMSRNQGAAVNDINLAFFFEDCKGNPPEKSATLHIILVWIWNFILEYV